MKNVLLIAFFTLLFAACGNSPKPRTDQAEQPKSAVVLTVDELHEKAPALADKEVVVKGTVMHVCKHGGQRCFLMGSNEDINIRVEAGEKIGAFGQELMGSELEVVGVLKIVKTEADAHNPGKEHGNGDDGEEGHDSETDNAHKIIAESQDAAEVVYFIEGLKVKEL